MTVKASVASRPPKAQQHRSSSFIAEYWRGTNYVSQDTPLPSGLSGGGGGSNNIRWKIIARAKTGQKTTNRAVRSVEAARSVFWTLCRTENDPHVARLAGDPLSFFLSLSVAVDKENGRSLGFCRRKNLLLKREARMTLAGVIKNKRKKKPHQHGCERGIICFSVERRGFCRHVRFRALIYV
jgi:hypothetical protein